MVQGVYPPPLLVVRPLKKKSCECFKNFQTFLPKSSFSCLYNFKMSMFTCKKKEILWYICKTYVFLDGSPKFNETYKCIYNIIWSNNYLKLIIENDDFLPALLIKKKSKKYFSVDLSPKFWKGRNPNFFNCTPASFFLPLPKKAKTKKHVFAHVMECSEMDNFGKKNGRERHATS